MNFMNHIVAEETADGKIAIQSSSIIVILSEMLEASVDEGNSPAKSALFWGARLIDFIKIEDVVERLNLAVTICEQDNAITEDIEDIRELRDFLASVADGTATPFDPQVN